MPQFFWAFMGEGNTDYAFVQNVVARTIDRLLFPSGYDTVPAAIRLRGERQADKIVSAAHAARGLHLLVVHLDADGQDETRAYNDRFLRGYNASQSETDTLREIVPVIPIRTSEAWMLANFEAFKQTVGTKKKAAELGSRIRLERLKSWTQRPSLGRPSRTRAQEEGEESISRTYNRRSG